MWPVLIAVTRMSSFNSHYVISIFIQEDAEPWKNMEISYVQPAGPAWEG